MKYFKSAAIIAITIILAGGCTEQRVVSNLDQKMTSVEQQINSLQTEINQLRSKIFVIELTRDVYNKIQLDTSSKGFQRIDTSCGSFMVSLIDVKPYSNGYKLILNIGNPYSARFSGLKLKAKWGSPFNFKDAGGDFSTYEKWQKSLQEKETLFVIDIMPSTWNRVELILAPAKTEELGYIELSMSVDKIALLTRR